MAEINTENNIKNTQSMDEHKTYMDRIQTVPSGNSSAASCQDGSQTIAFIKFNIISNKLQLDDTYHIS